jgi:cytochrome c-type biogenesis protein CcmH/NrfG
VLTRANRAHLVFAILSSLVICGLIAAALLTVSPANVFDGFGSADDGEPENAQDPGEDVIAEQQTVVATDPNDVESLLLLANLLGNSNRLGEAIPMFESALQLAPQDVNARLSFARALSDGGMSADAELQFRKALELEPDNQEAHYYLAELFRLSVPPRTSEAIVHYQRAAEIDSTTLRAERSREQLATLGVSSPAAGPAVQSAPVQEATP